MDSRICQTFTASPAEPGDLPTVAEREWHTNIGDAIDWRLLDSRTGSA